MLDISSLQYNAENPNLITVMYTVLSALGLGIVIAFTYTHTTSSVSRQNHCLQALVLVTVVAATIIQAIGDSVARGLGMLGALSIIRFRTTVRDPRNIVFVFAAIAAGIACGVFGFLIAAVGTIVFCMTAFLLKYSAPTGKSKLRGSLDIVIPASSEASRVNVERVINQQTASYELVRDRMITKGKKTKDREYRYTFILKPSQSISTLHEALVSEGTAQVSNLRMENPSIMEL